MAVEITNGELISVAYALKDLLGRADIPGRLSAKVARLARLVQPEIMGLNEIEDGVKARHAKKDENGRPIEAQDEHGNPLPGQYVLETPDEYWKEMQELMDSKLELLFTPFVDSDFDSVRLMPQTLVQLGPLVQEG